MKVGGGRSDVSRSSLPLVLIGGVVRYSQRGKEEHSKGRQQQDVAGEGRAAEPRKVKHRGDNSSMTKQGIDCHGDG